MFFFRLGRCHWPITIKAHLCTRIKRCPSRDKSLLRHEISLRSGYQLSHIAILGIERFTLHNVRFNADLWLTTGSALKNWQTEDFKNKKAASSSDD